MCLHWKHVACQTYKIIKIRRLMSNCNPSSTNLWLFSTQKLIHLAINVTTLQSQTCRFESNITHAVSFGSTCTGTLIAKFDSIKKLKVLTVYSSDRCSLTFWSVDGRESTLQLLIASFPVSKLCAKLPLEINISMQKTAPSMP